MAALPIKGFQQSRWHRLGTQQCDAVDFKWVASLRRSKGEIKTTHETRVLLDAIWLGLDRLI
jgi:hypothetical protein